MPTADQNTAGLRTTAGGPDVDFAALPRVVDPAAPRSCAGLTVAVPTPVRFPAGSTSLKSDVPTSSSSVNSYAPIVTGTPSSSGTLPLIRCRLIQTPLRLFRSLM